jgi:murein DD-endopeptidase MepM/ murein hydrolase activator NlpD
LPHDTERLVDDEMLPRLFEVQPTCRPPAEAPSAAISVQPFRIHKHQNVKLVRRAAMSPVPGVVRAITATIGAAIALTIPVTATAADVSVQTYPSQPLIERSRYGQALNFDLEVTNGRSDAVDLTAIRLKVIDRGGGVAQRLEINDNGIAPGLQTLPVRTWNSGQALTIYNPFHTLTGDVDIGRLEYEFVFRTADKQTVTTMHTVTPATYLQRVRLRIPLPGRVLVWDGHDFYSHHRRWDFSNPVSKQMGITTNPARYSVDLVVVDHQARFHTGDGSRREDYPTFGQTVVAPGDGAIVAAYGDAVNDAAPLTRTSYREDPLRAIYGNYIVIDHGHGEYSQLGHLQQGSVRVRVGDRVRQGEPIAAAGASGTSLFPHLHYQLVNAPGIDGEGLPMYFDEYRRIAGVREVRETGVAIDSGDIVMSSLDRLPRQTDATVEDNASQN